MNAKTKAFRQRVQANLGKTAAGAVKGIAIYPDKRVEDVTISGYKDGQAIVGGLIEPVDLKTGDTMYVNEEFIYAFDASAFNSIATDVAGLGGRPDLMLSGIKGPVYIVGPLDDEGYDTDISDAGRNMVRRVSREASKKTAVGEYDELGRLFERQFEDMKGKTKADTLPCPEHGDESDKGQTYASFPSSYTEYHCPQGHDFKVRVGTTREDILGAEGRRKTAASVARQEAELETEGVTFNSREYVTWDGSKSASRKAGSRKTGARTLSEIAWDIAKEWGPNVNYAAVPYLNALKYLNTVNDQYGADSARTVIAYFLSNASSFRGGRAKELKDELKALVKAGSKTASDWSGGSGTWHAVERDGGWAVTDGSRWYAGEPAMGARKDDAGVSILSGEGKAATIVDALNAGSDFPVVTAKTAATVCKFCGQTFDAWDAADDICPANPEGHRVQRQTFDEQFQVIDATPRSAKFAGSIVIDDVYQQMAEAGPGNYIVEESGYVTGPFTDDEKQAMDPQLDIYEWRKLSKTAASSFENDQVEVSDDIEPMWPWELDEEVETGEDAADVEGTHTPGQSVGDYPDPKTGRLSLWAQRARDFLTGIETAPEPFALPSAPLPPLSPTSNRVRAVWEQNGLDAVGYYSDADIEMAELTDQANDAARTRGRRPFDPATDGPNLKGYVESAIYNMTSVFNAVVVAADDYGFAADDNAQSYAFDVAQRYKRELDAEEAEMRREMRGSRTALNPQSGHGESDLDDVEVDDEDDRPMWPWEIGLVGDDDDDDDYEKEARLAWTNQEALDQIDLSGDTSAFQETVAALMGEGYSKSQAEEAASQLLRAQFPRRNSGGDVMAARSDYDHWNEDAGRVWWQEEGQHHGHEDPPDPDAYYDDDYLDDDLDDVARATAFRARVQANLARERR